MVSRLADPVYVPAVVTDSARRPPPPFLYFILFLPFGATTAFVSLTVVNIWSHDKSIGEAALAAMVAMNILPHTFKVLWAPIVDTVWNGRAWYIVGNLVSSAAILATGFVPVSKGNMGILTGLVLLNGFATTFVGMTTEALMAHMSPPEQRGLAAGWSQAGNVGGGIVGALALSLFDWTGIASLPAIVVSIVLAMCSVVLLSMPPIHPIDRPTFVESAKELGRDIKGIFWSRLGVIAAALSLLPIGSGAAANLFGAEKLVKEWHVSQNLVGPLNGIVGSVAAILGSLAGGVLSNKIEKKTAYALCGVALALSAFAMALMPRTTASYVLWVFGYQFALGMCYAAFTAFVLDIIGKGAAATKYNLLASLANIPITLMGRWDGQVAEAHGHGNMLWFDGAMGVAGAVVLLIIAAAALPRKRAAQSVSS
jgi:MFS transporter, PAT family, beta-lactamase induction signal transducer AmpG